jgi:hypothetical protein
VKLLVNRINWPTRLLVLQARPITFKSANSPSHCPSRAEIPERLKVCQQWLNLKAVDPSLIKSD